MNWDDIKFVLAVADTGSLNSTARRLGVTHATVMRRVAAFEQRCESPVFLKSKTGYSLLPEAEAILQAARNVEDAVFSVERAIHGSDKALHGHVRVASTDSICQFLLPKIVESIKETYPELIISILSANSHHDMSRMAADIAVRPTKNLEDGLQGSYAGDMQFGIYSARPDIKTWIGLGEKLSKSDPAKWMTKNVSQEQVASNADSFVVLREMIVSGLGRGLLPKFLGENDKRIQRVDIDVNAISVPVWCATPTEVSSNVRIKLVQNLIAEEMRIAL